MGAKKTAQPYIGNIHREVFPFKVMSLRRRAFAEVNRISIHQPVRPHFRKFFRKDVIACFNEIAPFFIIWLVFPCETNFMITVDNLEIEEAV